MIVTESKDLTEIIAKLQPYQKVLILGCGTCATTCAAGGAREVSLVAATLRLAHSKQDQPLEIKEEIVPRQCQREFLDKVEGFIGEVEAILCLACGAGVQCVADFAAEICPDIQVLPGLNTRFIGLSTAPGVWLERCRGCGECILDRTFGICPITRCAKSVLNGPCEDAQNGRCELSTDEACVWYQIYERARQLEKVEKLREIIPAKNWPQGTAGGVRKVVRGDMSLVESGQ